MRAGPFPIPMAAVRVLRVLRHELRPPTVRQVGPRKAARITVYSLGDYSVRERNSA
jgi:hypothetical protein